MYAISRVIIFFVKEYIHGGKILMQIIIHNFPLIPMITRRKTDKIKLDHFTTNFLDYFSILCLHEFLSRYPKKAPIYSSVKLMSG